MNQTNYHLAGKRVFVAGHRGMVGSAIVRRLMSEECTLLVADRETLNLSDENATLRWFEEQRPEVSFSLLPAAVSANDTHPVEFLYDNLRIQLSVIRAAHSVKVEKLLFLGSSCIYPKHAKQPIKKDELLTGPLEPTNEWYAIAKIAGLKMCQAFRRQYGDDFVSAMPTNLYGPGDNYHPEYSHVPAALLRRFHEAKPVNRPSVTVWGTGKPLREFLNVNDLADASVFLVKHYSEDTPINVGTGEEISIAEFASAVAEIVGFKGELVTKPDGTPRKLWIALV
jgi:GDP-L-fucose synthase